MQTTTMVSHQTPNAEWAWLRNGARSLIGGRTLASPSPQSSLRLDLGSYSTRLHVGWMLLLEETEDKEDIVWCQNSHGLSPWCQTLLPFSPEKVAHRLNSSFWVMQTSEFHHHWGGNHVAVTSGVHMAAPHLNIYLTSFSCPVFLFLPTSNMNSPMNVCCFSFFSFFYFSIVCVASVGTLIGLLLKQ